MVRLVLAALFALLASPAFAQWQVTDHSVPIGNGPGVVGFNSTGPGTAGQVLTSNGTSSDPTWQAAGAGSGTVTSLSVTSANGFAGSVANPTTTPAITLSTSVNGILSGNGTAVSAASTTGSGSVVLATSPSVSGLTVTGSLTATGLIANSALVNPATTVNGQTCTLGSTCTVTAAATGVTVGTTTVGSGTTTRVLFDNAGVLGEYVISGTGNVAMTTSPVFTTPNLGTPSALVGTNITGTASGLTAGTVTTNANLTGDVTSVGNATTLTNAPVIAKVLTGYVSGAGTITASDSILSAIQKLNGNDATNANLTGPITSTGNATAVASQTGTGSTFVMNTSPTLVTPVLGVAAGTSLSLSGLTASSAVATDGSKNLVSVTNTGTGNNVLATSPTLVTPTLGVASATSINFGGTALSAYAEGTFTPTVTCGTGTITTLGTVSGSYTKIGRMVFFSVDIAVTTNGTCATNLNVTNLPFTSSGIGSGTGKEINSTGKTVTAAIAASTAAVSMVYYDGTYPGGTGTRILLSAYYPAT